MTVPSSKLLDPAGPSILSRSKAIQAVLKSQGCHRPSTAVEGLAKGLLAVRNQLGEPGPLDLQDSFLTMAFNDWMYWPMEHWDPGVLSQGRKVLAAIALEAGSGAPLDLSPWPPSGTPAQVRNGLWAHLDALGLRSVALYQCMGLGDYLPEYADPYGEFPLLIDLLRQVVQSRSGKQEPINTEGILQGIADVLEACHRDMDGVLRAAGQRLPEALAWLRPTYPAAGPGETAGSLDGALPSALQEELAEALGERGSLRPVATMVPLAQLYARWQGTNDPRWRWVPEVDGRELAFLLFDATPDDPGPWTEAQARRFTELADRVHTLAAEAPQQPLPPYLLGAVGESAFRMLWRHVDYFAATITLGLMAPGHLPSPPYPEDTPEALRDHVELLLETQVRFFIALHQWLDLNEAGRRVTLENVAAALDAFQHLHLSLLERVLPEASVLLDPIAFPVSLRSAPRPARRPRRRR